MNNKNLFVSAVILALTIMAGILLIRFAIQQSFEIGYQQGYEAERAIERTIREYNCVPESDLPPHQAYIVFEEVKNVIGINSDDEKFPVKVCKEPEPTIGEYAASTSVYGKG